MFFLSGLPLSLGANKTNETNIFRSDTTTTSNGRRPVTRFGGTGVRLCVRARDRVCRCVVVYFWNDIMSHTSVGGLAVSGVHLSKMMAAAAAVVVE